MAVSNEKGMSSIIVLVVMFILAIVVLISLRSTYTDDIDSSRAQTVSTEKAACDIGLQYANDTLQLYPNWPEILMYSNPSSLAPAMQPLPTGSTTPPTPTTAFWQSCVANNMCAQGASTVTVSNIQYRLLYVMYPGGGLSISQNGSSLSQTGHNAGNAHTRYYIAFIHSEPVHGYGGFTINTIMRKVQMGE